MSIRFKIILIVLPLLIATGAIVGYSASLLARSGITRIAVEALGFKARELSQYAANQWQLLIDNNLVDNAEYRDLTQQAIASYSATLAQSVTEKIFAVNSDGSVAFQTGQTVMPTEAERVSLAELIASGHSGWTEFSVGGTERVGHSFSFPPFGWFVVVSDTVDAFYQEVEEINRQSWLILLVALGVSSILLFFFSNAMTRPIKRLVDTMRAITVNNDLSQRVDVEFRDEIGTLGKTFNIMIGELEQAYDQIKSFAYQAVLAKKNETKVRNIFQKYVPADVIDQFFEKPESMLTGQTRDLAVLFTDIRSFTTISESFSPEDLVRSLNQYFEKLVEIILENNGIVDKYIGDAIMAFFGAPVHRGDEPRRAVDVGLQIRDAVRTFNRRQREAGQAEFLTGIGINYGPVVVGNIGSERKMDYTVVGDAVNLASRMEGLTKKYGQEFLFSSSIYERVQEIYPCRFIDRVQVKGKTTGENIYTAERELPPHISEVWRVHAEGVRAYFARRFDAASHQFQQVLEMAPNDKPAKLLLERCMALLSDPPAPGWDGTEIMLEK